MDVAPLARIPPDLPVLTLVLQGAAAGALIASIVLCVARGRGLRVEPWAVTAAWSVLGAAVAGIAAAILALS